MPRLADIDINSAMTLVAVANTPVFLVRRLRENGAVDAAHKRHGSQAIFAALKSLSERNITNLDELTEVYVYLVSLSLDADIMWIRRARALDFSNIKWYKDISEILLASNKPVSMQTMTFPSQRPAIIKNGVPPRTANTQKHFIIPP